MDFTWLPIISALVCTGLISGILAGLLGVGGGIVIVPVLFFIFHFLGISVSTSMSIATGTSLLVIIATSVSSIRAHYKKGNIDTELLKYWAPFIVVGALLGSFLSTSIGGELSSIVFGVVAILVAMNMMFRANAKALFSSLPNRLFQSILAAGNGAISVIMGIGGGTLGVPVLTLCNYPVRRAVGTSATFGFLIALPGTLFILLFAQTPVDAPPVTVGFINFLGFAFIVPLSVIAAPLGVKIGSLINEILLKRLFSIFLCMSGARMIYQTILA